MSLFSRIALISVRRSTLLGQRAAGGAECHGRLASTEVSATIRLVLSVSQIGHNDRGLDPWGNPYEYLDIEFGSGTPRKDHALHPIDSDFDLYSKGKDGGRAAPITASQSRDDIVPANDGQFIGLASNY
jgi:general secretion pathway protein G